MFHFTKTEKKLSALEEKELIKIGRSLRLQVNQKSQRIHRKTGSNTEDTDSGESSQRNETTVTQNLISVLSPEPACCPNISLDYHMKQPNRESSGELPLQHTVLYNRIPSVGNSTCFSKGK